MTDTQGFFATGQLKEQMIDRSRLPIASGQNSLRIQDRNRFQEKITENNIQSNQNNIYYDIHHKNNFFNGKQQFYDFKDPVHKVDEQKPIHLSESRLKDKINYTNQIYKQNNEISKSDFQNKLESDRTQSSNNGSQLYQIHSYVSKPEKKLKDRTDQLVNSRCPSTNFPDWGSSTNRLYTLENLNTCKLNRKLNNQTKSSIKDQQKQKHDRPLDNFVLRPPEPTLIHEKKRMMVKDKTFDQLPHTTSKSKIRLQWQEQLDQQNYSRAQVCQKIGQEQYFAKKKSQDVSEYPIHEKKLLVKERAVLIKIGHGEAEKWIK